MNDFKNEKCTKSVGGECFYLYDRKRNGIFLDFLKSILPVFLFIVPFFVWQTTQIFELNKRVEIQEAKNTQIQEIKDDIREIKTKIELLRVKIGQ